MVEFDVLVSDHEREQEARNEEIQFTQVFLMHTVGNIGNTERMYPEITSVVYGLDTVG